MHELPTTGGIITCMLDGGAHTRIEASNLCHQKLRVGWGKRPIPLHQLVLIVRGALSHRAYCGKCKSLNIAQHFLVTL